MHNEKIKEAVILAGGLGTRLRPLVSDVPKPMANVKGKPFLSYVIDYWMEQGVERFIISVGYKYNIIIDYFGYSYKGVDIDYSIEYSPLGTGGGLIKSIEKLKTYENFLLLNGDTFFQVDMGLFSTFHFNKKALISVALFKSKNIDRFKLLHINNESKIGKFRSNFKSFVNGGVYIIDIKSIKNIKFNIKKISFEKDILDQYIQKKLEIYGYFCKNRFIDIGVPEDYKRVDGFV
jgi:D-glycero-alpha-D-manno-heptose 1-phosphate guanylyltransferase